MSIVEGFFKKGRNTLHLTVNDLKSRSKFPLGKACKTQNRSLRLWYQKTHIFLQKNYD